jgi:hypothetical protein
MDGQRPDETPAEWEQRNAAKKAANPNLGQLHRPLPVAVQNWATPRTGKTTDENPETWAKRQAEGKVATMPLTAQVKAWATPRAEHDLGRHRGQPDTLHSQIKAWGTPNARDWMGAPGQGCQERGGHRASLPGQIKKTENSGKLNPRWVETLMGLPVGWTMPSCASPVIPESTSSACLETASSPQSPSEPS